MTEAAFPAAFVGGVLSLLAPCSALLLPAFFAYASTSPTQLFGRTLLFLAGTSTLFVPLGMGASLVGALLIDYRGTTVLVAGLLLIGFGLMELAGRGFSLVPASVAGRFQGGSGALAAYSTGLAYGLTGFCSGPLVGSVLTLAAISSTPLLGGALLFTYSVGAAAPLFVIAWLWDRYQLGRRAWLRGRPLRLGPITVFSTNLIAGLMLILLGASLIVYQGSSALSGLYEVLGLTELGYRAQDWADTQLTQLPQLGWIALRALLVIGTIWLIRRSTKLSRSVRAGRLTAKPSRDLPSQAAPEKTLVG